MPSTRRAHQCSTAGPDSGDVVIGAGGLLVLMMLGLSGTLVVAWRCELPI